MMEMADYWILEKDLVPKLFQVIVPRYSSTLGPYTQVHKLPVDYQSRFGTKKICMELKNNALPPIRSPGATHDFSNSLTNILISSLKQDFKFKSNK